MNAVEILRQRLNIEQVPQSVVAGMMLGGGADATAWQQTQAEYAVEMLELARGGADVRGREEITRFMKSQGR